MQSFKIPKMLKKKKGGESFVITIIQNHLLSTI